MEIWEAHADEIKSMRDEINWRVKTAYTSIATFISAVVVILGFMLNKDVGSIVKENMDNVNLVILSFGGLTAMFIGILNANHLVEKRIELYTLTLIKQMFEIRKEPAYFWISYLYGYKVKRNSISTFLEKLFSASIGLFQYLVPNVISIGIIIGLAVNTDILDKFLFYYVFVSVLVVISFCSTVFLGLFLSHLNKSSNELYRELEKKLIKSETEKKEIEKEPIKLETENNPKKKEAKKNQK